MSNMNRMSVLLCFGLLLSAAIDRPASAQPQALLPNLRPLPAYELALRPISGGGTELVFSTLTTNTGLGPLHMVAGELTEPGQQSVYQRVHFSDGTFEDMLAGVFVLHEEHGHFHVEEYAEYQLEKEFAPGASTRIGQKTSFCLLDTNLVDRKLANSPKRAVFTRCDDFEFGQGISVGWGDAYRSHLPGQSIDVSGLESGNYLLTMVADPNDNILETDDLPTFWSTSPVLNGVRDLAVDARKRLDKHEDGKYFTFCMGVAETQTGEPLEIYPQAEINAKAVRRHYDLLQIEDGESGQKTA